MPWAGNGSTPSLYRLANAVDNADLALHQERLGDAEREEVEACRIGQCQRNRQGVPRRTDQEAGKRQTGRDRQQHAEGERGDPEVEEAIADAAAGGLLPLAPAPGHSAERE